MIPTVGMFRELFTLTTNKWKCPNTGVREVNGTYYFMRRASTRPAITKGAPSLVQYWKENFFFASIREGQTLLKRVILPLGNEWRAPDLTQVNLRVALSGWEEAVLNKMHLTKPVNFGNLQVESYLYKYGLMEGIPDDTWVRLLGEGAGPGSGLPSEAAPGRPEPSTANLHGGPAPTESAGVKRSRLEEMSDKMDAKVDATFNKLVRPSQKKASKGRTGSSGAGKDPARQKGTGATGPMITCTTQSKVKEDSWLTREVPTMDKEKGLAIESSPARFTLGCDSSEVRDRQQPCRRSHCDQDLLAQQRTLG
ncbi:hypothetical protein NE237_009844 [Protea cynaroides]|uniref:Uncharacterized protein n=1 Tax=Protea cynaroides TaxID=273540 RepID=A0A9Q0R112_9MAGN|nr:hypothetical protein NE237_009844 [Protea cynaroides]